MKDINLAAAVVQLKVKKKKPVETVIVEFEDYTDMDFREVSSFFIKNSMGQRVYFMTRSREEAQEKCNADYGLGHYKVNGGKASKSSGTESAVGRLGSKSRQGLRTKGN